METKTITNKFGIEQQVVRMTIEEMKSLPVNKTNFHDCSVANWIESDVEFIADYKSGSGSEYMYTEDGVYRKSDHWTNAVNTCIWLLDGQEQMKDTIGFCAYSDFKKYSSKRDNKNRISNLYAVKKCNIQDMLNGEFVKSHMIGNII